MNKSERIIANRQCYIYDCGSPRRLLIQPIGRHNLDSMDEEVRLIRDMCDGGVTVVLVLTDWNRELPPWEAEAVFGDEGFGCGAEATLEFIEEQLIPEIAGDEEPDLYLGGYSLAGLFALWAAYQTDTFAGVAAASPSVWYPGWMEYAAGREPMCGNIYLSIGKKEERTRNLIMRTVGDNIRKQHELLEASPACGRCELEVNPGNHFVDGNLRMAKGFAWLLEKGVEI